MSNSTVERRIISRLTMLERNLAQRPLSAGRGQQQEPAKLAVIIGQGNTLYSASSSVSVYGLRYPSSPVTTAPAVSPSSISSGITGLSAGRLVKRLNDGSFDTNTLVWVGAWVQVAPGVTIATPFGGPLPEGLVCVIATTATIPVSGGGTTTVYIPGRGLGA